MKYRNVLKVTLALLLALNIAGSSQAADEGVELASYQVPDLAPPRVPDPTDPDSGPIDDGEPIPAPSDRLVDDQSIPAPHVYQGTPYADRACVGTAVSLFDSPPIPYPGAELWAGRYGPHETLLTGDCPAAWASIDLLWLQRDDADDALLATDGNLATLRNSDFEFSHEAGVRIVYGEVINCIPIEFTYFGTHDWNASIALDGMNNLDVPGSLAGSSFNNASRLEADYASELHSLELNVMKFDGCHLTWLGGVRYLDAEEDFRLRANGNGAPGLLAISADNRLLGMQLGAELNYGCDNWCVGLTTKAGAYVNFAERGSLINDGAAVTSVRANIDDEEFAFVGQVELGFTRHIACGLKLRAGYEVMWIDGLALAAEQLGTTPTLALPGMNTDGDTFYDGGYIGLEWQR